MAHRKGRTKAVRCQRRWLGMTKDRPIGEGHAALFAIVLKPLVLPASFEREEQSLWLGRRQYAARQPGRGCIEWARR